MSEWHFHPKMYPMQAWRNDLCPDMSTAIALPVDDERVIRALTYPVVSR